MSKHRTGTDDGYTLIELLVTVVILGVIIGPLASAFAVSVRTAKPTQERFERSHDAQLAANYVVTDAQSADGPGIAISDDATTCGPSGGSPIVRMRWTSTAPGFTTTTENVNYVLDDGTLVRWTCTGGGAPWSSVTANVIGHHIDSAVVSCVPSPCGSTSTGLRVAVTETSGESGRSSYAYALEATFRKVTPTGVTSNPPLANLALMLLGSGTCLSLSSSGSITLPAGAAVGANCGGTMGSSGGITPSNTPVYSTGTCSGGVKCGDWRSGAAPLVDPYAAKAYPARTSAGSDNKCPSGTLNPGMYQKLELKDKKCTLNSGVYVAKQLILGDYDVQSNGPVLIYLDGTGLLLDSGGKGYLMLEPYSTGVWNEFVLIGNRTGSDTEAKFTGQGGLTGQASKIVRTGIVYMPKTKLIRGGDPSSLMWPKQLIVRALELSSGGGLKIG